MLKKDYSEIEKRINNDINKFGFHIIFVPENEYLPSFAYTIGLYKTYKHSEIILFGLQQETSFTLLNNIGEEVKKGKVYQPNKNYQDISNYPMSFIEVNKEHYQDYLGWGIWFYDGNCDFPVCQLVWTDQQNNYPWEETFDKDLKFRQPILDRNTDFKFYEERNLGVYTTRDILEGKPILEVYHNEDGDWQFFNESSPDLDKIKLVSLESLVRMDSTLNELFYLNYGESAFRESIDSKWRKE